MPTKPIDRLIFVQGGQCFFCGATLTKADASVEHLVAVTHGGKDNDENCVACCKAPNNLFGRMSLKEKLQIVLRQKGEFRCPAGATTTVGTPKSMPKSMPKTVPKGTAKGPRSRQERFALVVADLHKRGNAKPGTVDKLLNTIKSHLVQLGEPSEEARSVLNDLTASDYVKVTEEKVIYALPAKSP